MGGKLDFCSSLRWGQAKKKMRLSNLHVQFQTYSHMVSFLLEFPGEKENFFLHASSNIIKKNKIKQN